MIAPKVGNENMERARIAKILRDYGLEVSRDEWVEDLIRDLLAALPVEPVQPSLDPEPFVTDTYSNSGIVSTGHFAPRPEYSQNRADYETGEER